MNKKRVSNADKPIAFAGPPSNTNIRELNKSCVSVSQLLELHSSILMLLVLLVGQSVAGETPWMDGGVPRLNYLDLHLRGGAFYNWLDGQAMLN